VRQGDPLSPILFDYVVDALDAILEADKGAGHISGVIPHIIHSWGRDAHAICG
jgi:hypothetical protein